MIETPQNNNPDYIIHHPEAVEGKDVAHTIAMGQNRHRSVAAEYRRAAVLALELSMKPGEDMKNFNDAYDSVTQVLEEDPDNKAAKERYGALGRIPSSHDLKSSIDTLKRTADEYDQLADPDLNK